MPNPPESPTLISRIRAKLGFLATSDGQEPLSFPVRVRTLVRLLTAPFGVEPYTVAARVRGKFLFLVAWPTLLAAMRRQSHRTELWIGDSHAMSVNRDISNSMFMRAPQGQLILRVGARLMYSLARQGFPPRVMRVARLVNRFGRPGALVPIFSSGEIDVRVHLVARPDETFGFVADYVDQCMVVARLLKADRVAFMVPVPPVNLAGMTVWFPVTGTLDERLAVHGRLRDALAAAVNEVPQAALLDFTALLSGPTGGMPRALTSDGAHTNRAAVRLIRTTIADSGLLVD